MRMTLVGEADVRRLIEQADRAVGRRPVRKVLLKGARVLRTAVRARTPHKSLRRAVRAKNYRGGVLGAYVMANYSGKFGARHWHLYEYGTPGARVPVESKVLRFVVAGEVLYRRVVRSMPARPTFRPAVIQTMPKVKRQIERDLLQLVIRGTAA